MKTFTLKKINIQDFRSITTEIAFCSNGNIIKGCNGIGKSTILNAYLWCLTGYTSATAPKNYNLYDNREDITKLWFDVE